MSAVGSPRAPGCLVCALPTKVRAALHLDHAQGLSARRLALRYKTPAAPLSTSAVRLHLKTHVPPPPGASAGGCDSERLAGAGDYAAFIEGPVDAEGVLVATIRRTLRDLATMEGDVATARSAGNDADAIRAMTVVLRTKHLLVRELKAYTGSTGRTEPAVDLTTVPTVFDALIDKPIDDQVVLEVTTRALLQKLRAVEAEYLTAERNPETAERALSIFLKTQAPLERALQRLHDARQRGDRVTHIASVPAGDGGPIEPLRSAFDGILEGQVSAHAISQAVVRAIAEKMKRVEQEYQTALRAGDADQALTKFLKMLPLLQRALERFKETGKPQEEIKETLQAALKELSGVAFVAVDKFMNAHVDTLHKLVAQCLDGKLIPKLLKRYLEDYRTHWRGSLGLDLRHDLIVAYEKSKLWRQLRNYPQPSYDDASVGSAKPGASKTNDMREGVTGEQSTRCAMEDTESFRVQPEGYKPKVTPGSSDQEESTATNEPRSTATDVQARPYTAAMLVEAMRRGDIDPTEALTGLRESAALYSMDDLSRVMTGARAFPEVKQEAMRLLAQRDKDKGPH